jgi:C1A family cysteine protease
MKERMGLRGFMRSNETETEDEQILQSSRTILQAADTLPENFNWYSKNVLTPVKDQLSCGSCWSFVTVNIFNKFFLKLFDFILIIFF